jgi:hypothetical protein
VYFRAGFVQLTAMVALVTLVFVTPDLRNFLLKPVGSAPSGQFGVWAAIPIFSTIKLSAEGSLSRGLHRVVGTVIGAVLGLVGGITSTSSLAGGSVVITLFAASLVFLGMKPDRFGVGVAKPYEFQVGSYTSVIVAVDAVFSCSEPGDESSLCQYTVVEMFVIRLLSQLCSILLAGTVSFVFLPLWAGPRIRREVADALIVQAERIEMLFDAADEAREYATDMERFASKSNLLLCSLIFFNLKITFCNLRY